MMKFFECTFITAFLLIAMLIAQFVFLVPTMKNKQLQLVYTLSGLTLCLTLCIFLGKLTAVIGAGFLIGVFIFLTCPKKKLIYLQTMRLFPIIGLTLGIIMPLSDIPALFYAQSAVFRDNLTMFVDSCLLLFILIVFIMCGSWHRKLRKETRRRKLSTGEHCLLDIIGVLMLAAVPTVTAFGQSCMYENTAEQFNVKLLCCISLSTCLVVTLTVCILVMRSSQNTYLRDQMMQMQNNLIITMADIVENRDENTGGHIRRTAKYVEIIGNSLKAEHLYTNILTDQYLSDMIIAAPLHDIGKIHIPDAVLKKEGRFTEEEFRIMKSHTVVGKLLLLRAEKHLGYSDYLSVAVQMAGYHHEWWNGRGYPEGLKGQDIPLCARIMAVADVFDSLVSQRCYKGAMSIETAFSLIEREKGTHFDPVIVDAFLGAREEIAAIAHEFTEHPLTQDIEHIPLAGTAVPVRPELDDPKFAKAV